jgi:hypothetical protein
MSEVAAKPQKLSLAETRLQYILLGTTVPLMEGGGVVFPKGFPGKGYRLDDWQFDRYRAGLDQTMLSDAAKKRTRLAIGVLLLYFVLIFAAAQGTAWLRETALYNSDLIALLPVPLFLIVVAGTLFALHVTNRPTMRFAEQFQGSPRVGRFAFLRQRAIALFASGLVKPAVPHLRLAINLAIVFFLFSSAYIAENHPYGAIIVALLLVYSTFKRLYLCYVFWSFRLAHGRAPKPADLKPVSLSQA